MKNYISLRILDRFEGFFTGLDLDYQMLRRILQVKLAMDTRRSSILNPGNKKAGKNLFRTTMFVYGVYGLFILLFLFLPSTLFIRMSIIFSVFFFVITSTMISDFSTVLLDIKDRNILLSRPINSKTVSYSRIIHVFIYLSMISMAFLLPVMVVGAFKEGILFPLLLLVEMFFIISFIIFLTSLVYGLVLYFTDGERLKNIINYTQIGLVIFLPICYQMISNIFEVFQNNISIKLSAWTFFLPPLWFAAPFQIILEGGYNEKILVFSFLSLVIPLLGLLLYNRYISVFFEKKLVKLSNATKKTKSYNYFRDRVTFSLTTIFGGTYQENVFLRFIRKNLAAERMLRLFIYPIIVFSFIFPFLLLSRMIDIRSFIASLSHLSKTNYYMWFYSTVIFLPTLTTVLTYSSNYKGAWLYSFLPIEDYSILNRARVKAVLYKYCLPIFIIIGFIFTIIFGFKIIDDLLLMALNLIFLTVLLTIITGRDLPFSYELSVQTKLSKTTLLLILSSLVGGLLAWLHLNIINNGYYIWFNIIIMVFIIALIWKYAFKRDKSWK